MKITEILQTDDLEVGTENYILIKWMGNNEQNITNFGRRKIRIRKILIEKVTLARLDIVLSRLS